MINTVVTIIGGGPTGIIAAINLVKKCGKNIKIKIFFKEDSILGAWSFKCNEEKNNIYIQSPKVFIGSSMTTINHFDIKNTDVIPIYSSDNILVFIINFVKSFYSIIFDISLIPLLFIVTRYFISCFFDFSLDNYKSYTVGDWLDKINASTNFRNIITSLTLPLADYPSRISMNEFLGTIVRFLLGYILYSNNKFPFFGIIDREKFYNNVTNIINKYENIELHPRSEIFNIEKDHYNDNSNYKLYYTQNNEIKCLKTDYIMCAQSGDQLINLLSNIKEQFPKYKTIVDHISKNTSTCLGFTCSIRNGIIDRENKTPGTFDPKIPIEFLSLKQDYINNTCENCKNNVLLYCCISSPEIVKFKGKLIKDYNPIELKDIMKESIKSKFNVKNEDILSIDFYYIDNYDTKDGYKVFNQFPCIRNEMKDNLDRDDLISTDKYCYINTALFYSYDDNIYSSYQNNFSMSKFKIFKIFERIIKLFEQIILRVFSKVSYINTIEQCCNESLKVSEALIKNLKSSS